MTTPSDDLLLQYDWRTALKKTYRVTPEELVHQFGLSIDIPHLKPCPRAT